MRETTIGSVRCDDVESRRRRRHGRRGGPSGAGHVIIARLGVGFYGLLWASGAASAHGATEHGGVPVEFALVVALPVVAGLAGGALAVLLWRADRPTATATVGFPFGLLLVGLGLAFALGAVMQRLWLGIAVGAVGGLAALLATRRWGVVAHGCHAEVALGAISLHRLLEGLAIGALYASGTAVGLLGALVVAGHTALETAAVGGLPGRHRIPTGGAVVIVQLCYAVGAVVGLAVAAVVPDPVQIGALALAGGVLLGVGAIEAGHRALTRYRAPLQ